MEITVTHAAPSMLATALFFGILWIAPIGGWVLRRRIAESHGMWQFFGRALQAVGVFAAILAVPATVALFLGAGAEALAVARDVWVSMSK